MNYSDELPIARCEPQILQLRPLQEELIARVAAAFRSGVCNLMVCAPCAFGKTEVATAMLLKTLANGKRGAFVCDRIQLVNQTSQRFDKYGLDHGIRQASHPRYKPGHPIQLCTIQTLHSRGFITSDLWIHDEAHDLKKGAKDLLLKRQGRSIGLSATPMTRGLGKYFDGLVTAATTQQLMDAGMLVPFDAYDYKKPDMDGVKIVGGEYEEGEGEKRCVKIVGDVVEHYQKHAGGRAFVAFAFSVAHAEEMKAAFLRAGIKAETYHYRKSDEENRFALEALRREELQGIISIESLTRAFDDSHIEVMICARPLRKAIHVLLQMIGRILRTHPGKTRALILDHSGNMSTFGAQVVDYMENGVEALDDGNTRPKQDTKKPEKKFITCPKCAHLFTGPFCPKCGYVLPPKKSGVEREAGELRLLDLKALRPKDLSMESKTSLYGELRYLQQMKGKSDSWFFAKYRSLTGVWPRGITAPHPLPLPSRETLARLEKSDQEYRARMMRNTYRDRARQGKGASAPKKAAPVTANLFA